MGTKRPSGRRYPEDEREMRAARSAFGAETTCTGGEETGEEEKEEKKNRYFSS